MSSENLELFHDGLSADRILSFVNILKITSKTDEFQEWVRLHHQIEVDEHIFVGYKFFLSVCIRGIVNSVIYEESLGLDEDFTFFRARFVGVTLEDIPNTCEKTVFIKNVWLISRQLRKAKNWEDLNEALESLDRIVFSFDHFFEDYISVTNSLGKDECLRVLTIIYTHIFLNDTGKGIPHIYRLVPILKTNIKEQYMEKAYLGYVYALQYLWFALLEENKFKKTSLRELHKAHIIYHDVNEELDDGLELQSFTQNHLITNKEKNNSETFSKWLALDSFFGKINEEIVFQIKKELNTDIVFHPLLKVKKGYDKKYFAELLSVQRISDPVYLAESTNHNLIKKRLDYLFLWYNIDLLDSQELMLFNGLPSFISVLLGTVESSRLFAQEDIISVLKFKHPIEGTELYDYSYAVLVHAFSGMGISDYSGWLVFYDCATDYESSDLLFLQAEHLIDTFVEESKIEIKTELVGKDIFKEYLSKKIISAASDGLSLSEIKSKADIFAAEAKGKLFEYAFCNWLLERHSTSNSIIKFDVQENNEQIDAYEEFEDRIELYECKVQLHTEKIGDVVDQVKRKVKALSSDKTVIPNVVIYMPRPPKDKNEFKKAGIHFHDNFKANIFERLNQESKKKLSSVIEFKINQITEEQFWD